LQDSFKKGKPKSEQLSKVRKQVLGLGTYFHQIKGIGADDSPDYDFILVDVDVSQYDYKSYRIDY